MHSVMPTHPLGFLTKTKQIARPYILWQCTTLLKEYRLSLLWSPGSWLATQCVGAAAPGTTLGREGRQLKKDSVNDSNVTDGLRNVTEGVPSLPPVESQDTAYEPKSKVTDRYAMRAPGRARNNIKEGGSVDSNDTEIGRSRCLRSVDARGCFRRVDASRMCSVRRPIGSRIWCVRSYQRRRIVMKATTCCWSMG